MRCVLRALQQQQHRCLTLYRLKSTLLSPLYYTRRALSHAPPTPPSAPAVPTTSDVVPSQLCSSSSTSPDVALLSLGNVQHVVLRNIDSLSRRRQALLWRDLQYLLSCETAARARWQNVKHSNEEVTKATRKSARQPRSVRAAQRMLATQLATGVYDASPSHGLSKTQEGFHVHAQRCVLAVRRMAALLDANATAVLQHCTSMDHLSGLQGMAQSTSESSSASSVTTQSVHRHIKTMWAETNCEDGATPHNVISSSWLTSEEVCAAVEWGAKQLCQLADSLRTTRSHADNKEMAVSIATLEQRELLQCVHVLNEGLRVFMRAITAHVLICASLVLRDTAAEKRVGHACRHVVRAVLQCLRVVNPLQPKTHPSTSHAQLTRTLPDELICEALCSQREDWQSALQLAREVCECTTCPSHVAANSVKENEETTVKVVAHGLSDAAFAILLYCLAQHEGCGELVRQLHTARATSAHDAHKHYIGMSTSLLLALAEANTSSTVSATKPHSVSDNDEEEDALVHVIHNGWLPQRRLSLVEYWQLLRRISMRQRSSHNTALPWEGMSVRHTQWVLSPAAIWMHSHTLPYEVRATLCLMSFLQARHRTHAISHYGTSQPVSRSSSSSSNSEPALSLEDLYVVLRLTRQMREEWLSCLVRARDTVLSTHTAQNTNSNSDNDQALWWRLAGRRSTAPATSNAFLGELAAVYEDIVHTYSTRKQNKTTTTAAHQGFASSFSIMHGMVARELLCLLLHRALCEHSLQDSCHGVLTALRLVMREKEAYMYIAFVPDVVLTRSATCLAVGLARCLGIQPDSCEEGNSGSENCVTSRNAHTSYTSLLIDAFVRLAPMLSSFVLASLVQYGPLASLLRFEWHACAALVPYAPLRSRCQLELLLRVARATEGQFGLNAKHTHNDEIDNEACAARSWQSAALAFLTQPYTTHSHHNTRNNSDDDGRYALGLFLLQAGQLSTVQLLACYHRMSVRVQKMTAAHVLRLIVHTAVATPQNRSSDYPTERVAFRELMQSEAFAQLVRAALGCDYNSNDTTVLTRSSTYSQLSTSVVLVEAVMHTLLQAQMWYEGLRFRQLVQCVRPDLLCSSQAMPGALIHTLHASYVRRIQDHATLLARGLLARSALVDLVARLTRAVNQRRWQDAIRVFTQYIQGDSLCEDNYTNSNSTSDEVAVCAMPPVEQRRMRALERQGTVQVLTRELSDVGHALRYAALMCAAEHHCPEYMDAVSHRDLQLALQYVPIAQLPLPTSHAALLTQHQTLVASDCENEWLALQQSTLLTGVSLTGQHTALEEEGSDDVKSKEYESETMLLVEWARLHAREEHNRAQRSTSTQSPQLYTNTQPPLASQARMLAIQAMMCWPPLLHSALPLHEDNSIASTSDYTSVSEAEVQLLTWLRAALPSQFTVADFTTWPTTTDPSLQQQRSSDSLSPSCVNNTMTQGTNSQPALWAEALRCFSQLPSRARPDTATLRAALRACALGAQWQYALQLLHYCTLTRASFDSTNSNSVVSDAAQLALRTAVQAGAWAAALHVAHSYRHTRDPQLVHCLLVTYVRVGAASEAIELGYDCLRRRVRLQDRSLQLLLEASQALSAEHAATAHALRSLVTTEEDMYVLSSAMQEHVRQMMQICELPVEPRQLLASVHMHLTTARRELEI